MISISALDRIQFKAAPSSTDITFSSMTNETNVNRQLRRRNSHFHLTVLIYSIAVIFIQKKKIDQSV